MKIREMEVIYRFVNPIGRHATGYKHQTFRQERLLTLKMLATAYQLYHWHRRKGDDATNNLDAPILILPVVYWQAIILPVVLRCQHNQLSMFVNEAEISNPLSTEALQQFAWQTRLQNHRKALTYLKRGIWLYIWLLLFEGALRKWVLPGLATPLLVVRDPVAIWLMAYGYMNGYFKNNIYLSSIFVVGIISLLMTLLVGHGNLGVALFGIRILLLHFPVIFLIGQVFSKNDVIQVGKALLWATILMTVIIAIQFNSPQTAWINVGVGGVGSSGFVATQDYFRPSGLFSFTNGVSNFYGLAGCFICFFWIDNTPGIPKWLLILATVSLFAAIPLSISRSVFYQAGLSVFFAVFLSFQNTKLVSRTIAATIGGLLIIILLNKTSLFQASAVAFTDRFESANRVEGGSQNALVGRGFGGFLAGFRGIGDLPFWGYGLGLGTNAGAVLLTGKATFLFNSESEWGRVIGEMGILTGLIFILLRVGTGFIFLTRGYKQIKSGNYLPWLISSFAFMSLLQGQWGQVTSLGFSIVSSGLALAALSQTKITPQT